MKAEATMTISKLEKRKVNGNKTYRHNFTEILLKVALNTITLPNFIVCGLTQLELKPMIYCTRREHADQFITDVVHKVDIIYQ